MNRIWILTILAIFLLVKINAQNRRHHVHFHNSNTEFSTFPLLAAGPVFLHNYKLNQWILENNGQISQSFVAVDLMTIGRTFDKWYSGTSLNIILGENFNQLCSDYIVGRQLHKSNFFESQINSSISFFENRIYKVIPGSIKNPDSKDYLYSVGIGLGVSNTNAIKLKQWNRSSLHFGFEYGIKFLTNVGGWEFGHTIGSGKHSHFVGVNVPEVPNIDPYYTYLKFSIQLKF